MIDALVLAGSPNDGPLKSCSGAKYEALIPIGKRAMVEYVVDALTQTPSIDRVLVVGPDELQPLLNPTGIEVISAKNTVMENVLAGFELLADSKKVLVVSSDIPLLTSESIDKFIDLCKKSQADLYFPVVTKETVEKKFPQMERTYVKLKEGTFTGGNVFLVNPQIMPQCYEMGQRFIDLRKSPLKLCGLLGVSFVAKYVTGRLTIKELEKKVSSLLGVTGSAVICPFPEVGVDVDKPSDLSLVMKAMGIDGC
ncbi:nucleotidyltransferase family protein [Desulfofalx alkaliphila]|uniref:nucleotidyltransferase family protein n=1 Tax=Desulfofalx alkaliphila TaxID=105483 RepID=UPI0004E1D66E|nr:nucleotidyltransferase family protein [Desulfofalx alkaliphila]